MGIESGTDRCSEWRVRVLRALPASVMLTVRRIDAGSHGAWLSLVLTLWLCAPLPKVEMAWTSFTTHGPYGEARPTDVRVAILAYHRFGPIVADSMTVRTATRLR